MDRRGWLMTTAAAATAATLKSGLCGERAADSAKLVLQPWIPGSLSSARCREAAIRAPIWKLSLPRDHYRACRFPGLRRPYGGRARGDRVPLGRQGPVHLPAWRMVLFSDIPYNPHYALHGG